MSALKDFDSSQFKSVIDQKLSKSGEKQRLKEFLRQQLSDCGWREEIKLYRKEYIQNKGLETVSVDKLIEEITPHARGNHPFYQLKAKVPESIKTDLFNQVRSFLNESQ